MKEYQIKDEIQAEVVNVSQEERRIGLSIRKLEESSEREIHKGYVKNQQQATSNLGELLKEKMMHSQSQASQDGQESEMNATTESESETPASAPDSLSEKP
jgi:small subunit ribosomal protein S1